MNTKMIMTVSSMVPGIAGVLLIFMPGELLNYVNQEKSEVQLLQIQISGALYFSFALLNRMSRENLIGGFIINR